jgi:hypothetical protein
MNEFDPAKPATVHARLNDRSFEWKPETMQANYEKYASRAPTASSNGTASCWTGGSRYQQPAGLTERHRVRSVFRRQVDPPFQRGELHDVRVGARSLADLR